jgi:hypothetical protein
MNLINRLLGKFKTFDRYVLKRYYRHYYYFTPPILPGQLCIFTDHLTGKESSGHILSVETLWTEHNLFTHRYQVSVVNKPYKLYVYELSTFTK